jgi:voltage-gated hydrogen channel 1
MSIIKNYDASETYDNLATFEEKEPFKLIPIQIESKKKPNNKIKSFLESHRFHTIIVILVIVDCLCVAIELIIEHVEKYVLGNNDKHSHSHLYFHIIENILKYTSLTILALFVIEIIVKLIFVPRIFVKLKWEILDALVVIISFGVNLYLLFNKHLVTSVGILLTLLRLWRITEIVNGK